MSLGRNLPGFLVASVIGVVSGVYIFKPIVQQEAQSGAFGERARLEAMRELREEQAAEAKHAAEDAKVEAVSAIEPRK